MLNFPVDKQISNNSQWNKNRKKFIRFLNNKYVLQQQHTTNGKILRTWQFSAICFENCELLQFLWISCTNYIQKFSVFLSFCDDFKCRLTWKSNKKQSLVLFIFYQNQFQKNVLRQSKSTPVIYDSLIYL